MSRKGLISFGLICTSLLLSISCSEKGGKQVEGQKSPNILLILADDMGYSDLNCFGGEICTPSIDRLANEGVCFTQFYNAARCCPTRASILTGLYAHQAGIGNMVATTGERAVGPDQGFLTRNSVTIAEVLREAGYYTAISGKWHVGEHRPNWPLDRGFDNYYGLISGAANYFDVTRPKNNEVKRIFAIDSLEQIPQEEDFYMTDALTENAIRFLKVAEEKEQPFFLYLPYTAPHWPLHAKQEDIAKYKGMFHEGWDVLREKRYQRMIDMGVIDGSWDMSERDPRVTPWDELDDEQKARMEILMEIYAAQIDCMDQGIGKVLQQLEDMDAGDNTIVMFLSDNGASAEYHPLGRDFWGNFWDGDAVPGSGDSYHSYGGSWANLSNTPFRKYKRKTHEGGISTPFIVRWPERMTETGTISDRPAHIIDIMATVCDIVGCEYPEEYQGHEIESLMGRPFTAVLTGEEDEAAGPYFWEHEGNRAVRNGKWKLVSFNKKPWELYDMEEDRTETHNLIEQHPEIAQELQRMYEAWAKKVGANRNGDYKK